MDKFPQMVYRFPGSEAMHGAAFDTLIVNDHDELAEALQGGYAEGTEEAKTAHVERVAAAAAASAPHAAPAPTPADFPTTREGLEELATKLEVEFKPSTSDKKLAEALKAKLAEAQ